MSIKTGSWRENGHMMSSDGSFKIAVITQINAILEHLETEEAKDNHAGSVQPFIATPEQVAHIEKMERERIIKMLADPGPNVGLYVQWLREKLESKP